jgi:two-component system, NarL family, nitrate/nitrite response regulator NarL
MVSSTSEGAASYRAILVSENRLFRDGVRSMLGKSRISMVAEGADIPQLLNDLKLESCPDLVIFHLASDQNPETALTALDGLRAQFAQAKLVVLADACSKPILPSFVRADVSAVLLTDISSDNLERSLELVVCDHRLFPADVISLVTGAVRAKPWLDAAVAGDTAASMEAGESVSRQHARKHAVPLRAPADGLEGSTSLSRRECQVVRCLAIGLSNKTIARELNITEGTVKVHVKGLLRKIRARNRTQLAIWALRQADMVGADLGVDTR